MEYISEAIASGKISGDGLFTRKCEALLEDLLDAPRVLLTPSCTHALEMAALLLDVAPGDEVIVPSFTFVSTANAFVMRGARPIFADIRNDTLNLDESQLERLITPRTKAIVPVHYGGVACEMDAICALAEDRGVAIIEDNAHGLFGSYRGRPLGSFGRMATQSFHETKHVTCGEGGALVLNQKADIERAEIVREKGTDRSRFFRGEIDKYTWVDLGSSYLMSDVLAAFLFGQLEYRDRIQEKRGRLWQNYSAGLAEWAAGHGVQLAAPPGHCAQTHYLFYLLMPTHAHRQAMIKHLRREGILAVFHFLPLHLSPFGMKFGGEPGQCPNSENVSEVLVRLPFFNSLSEDDQSFVIEKVLSFSDW